MVSHADSRLRQIARSVLNSEPAAANTEQPEWWKNKRAPNPLLPPRAISPASDVDEGMPDSTVPFLTPNDVTHFVEHGFIVKRKLIPAELLTPWLDKLWAAAPPSVNRTDSSTWVEPAERWGPNSTDSHGPFTADGRSTSRDPHHLTPNSQWRAHVLGHDPEFVAATSGHPKLMHIVEQLLGGPLRKPTRNRGIYSIFPRPGFAADDPTAMLSPHLDMVPMELNGALYLDEVGERSGAFTVWPGSHTKLYRASSEDVNFVPIPGVYEETLADVKDSTQPVEFAGGVGDVILVHPFLLHSTGVNTSQRIRHATILDFNRVWSRQNLMWEVLSDPEGGGSLTRVEPDGTVKLAEEDGELRAVVRWHHDCMEWCPPTPVKEDMWSSWNLNRVPAAGNVVEEQPWWVKYGMDLPPPHESLKSIASFDRGAGLWRLHTAAHA